jgi:hypothetical protein
MIPKYFWVILAMSLSLSSQAQVSGFLGKRKSFSFYTELTTSTNPAYRATKKAIEYNVNNSNGEISDIGAYVRLGVEYAHVYKRRKQRAGSIEVFRNGIGKTWLYASNSFEASPVFTTVHGIKLSYLQRTYGRKTQYSNLSNGNIAPLGRFTGWGLQVKLYQFRLHDTSKGEIYGVNSLKGAAPDILYEFGRNYAIAEKYLLTTSWRFGLLGIASLFGEEGRSSDSYTNNGSVLKKEAQDRLGWVDLYRFHIAFSLMK